MIGTDQAPVLLVKSDPAVNVANQLVTEQTALAMPGHMHLHKQLSTDSATHAVMIFVRQMVVHVSQPLGGLITLCAIICNLFCVLIEQFGCLYEVL